MGTLRSFLLAHRALAACVLAAALCLKVLVPAGYMAAPSWTTLTISVCADASGSAQTREIAVPVKGDAQHAAKGECAFSVLGMGALAGADSALLAAALVFVLALGFAAQAWPAPQASARLRPPLRAPPELA